MKNSIVNRIILLSLVIILSSCGVKPGSPDSPAGEDKVEYPRTYPDINTDPKPSTTKKNTGEVQF
jgi:hypothetical protein